MSLATMDEPDARRVQDIAFIVRDAFLWHHENGVYTATFSGVKRSRPRGSTVSLTASELIMVNPYIPQMIDILIEQSEKGELSNHASGSMVNYAIHWQKHPFSIHDTRGSRFVITDFQELLPSETGLFRLTATCRHVCAREIEGLGLLPNRFVPRPYSMQNSISVTKQELDLASPGWEQRYLTAELLNLPRKERANYILGPLSAPAACLLPENMDSPPQ